MRNNQYYILEANKEGNLVQAAGAQGSQYCISGTKQIKNGKVHYFDTLNEETTPAQARRIYKKVISVRKEALKENQKGIE